MGDREGEGPHRDDGTMLKNIRGFLMKRRKSPLKGWHKVRGYYRVPVCPLLRGSTVLFSL